ncbi:Pentatricopeptide repeat [Trema orientale]|uniref:Pentatricopeptide repeat n=1 Tax=Trema orientale TaxID=63057 RepID=A0A2P5BDH9_TREOI|nr:Pentatricopeptide repeat [Trema orientale]
MAAPLSLHHIKPPLSSYNSPLRNPNLAAAAAAAAAVTASTTSITTNNKASNNNPIGAHTCLALLEKCSDMSQLKQIHAQMLRTGLFFDAFTAAKIIAFCALDGDNGSLPYARLVFAQIPNPTTYTCNSIIRGYTNRDWPLEAILFYREMISNGFEPDRFTFPSLFKSCGDLREGKQLHYEHQDMTKDIQGEYLNQHLDFL